MSPLANPGYNAAALHDAQLGAFPVFAPVAIQRPPASAPASAPASGSTSTAGADLLTIAKRGGAFIAAGVIVLLLAGTRYRVLAWGMLSVALIYSLMAGRGAQLIADVNKLMGGSQ